MTNNIPFPQADDFEKIMLIINVADEDLLNDTQYMRKYLKNITGRQVSYFLSAAMYLDIIDKNKTFTKLGKKLRMISGHNMQKVEIINVLLDDEIIRYAYTYERIQHIPLNNDYIAKMIHEKYPSYSLETCKRRGQTVKGWVEWMKRIMR